ncbi:MAG: trehalose 6-phosphate phosphatase [Desulfuromonadales bacterium]|jgi:alpha,alpha-trehalase|nr:trehalose 6-phosphate phosphatase [Desulfuromonadales bacterium]
MTTPANRHLSLTLFDAVIFDMDGVVTRTAKVHAAAWKEMFDDFLKEYAERSSDHFEPFSIEHDYTRYVDGKPRYDGVRDFLASRNIEIPPGEPDDPPDKETVCGLGNRKNRRFQQMLSERGAECYESTVIFIRKLRKAGIATGVISASKNCREVLEAAGVANLFDVRVDGIDAERLAIPGKPEPDIFREAVRRLGVSPGRTVVVEDALAGVEAGRRGDFGLVIGIDRADQAARLARFADIVVADLKELSMEEAIEKIITDDLPSALEDIEDIGKCIQDRQVVVFLDYDGTLTPIVERPELARLSEEMRQALRELAGKCTLAIISGRDLADVQDLVAIDGILYAGSHGFDISGPEGRMEYQQGRAFLPSLDRAEESLRKRLETISGCQVERKHFAIAVHFRRVNEAKVPEIETAVDDVLTDHEDLRKTGGKKIFELRPDIDWDKGRAVAWILMQLGLDGKKVLPFYIGDDLTDEDAFRELREKGIGILVRDENRLTMARYAVENTEEVRLFLHSLAQLLTKGSS